MEWEYKITKIHNQKSEELQKGVKKDNLQSW